MDLLVDMNLNRPRVVAHFIDRHKKDHRFPHHNAHLPYTIYCIVPVTMKETELAPLSELEAGEDEESDYWEEESQNTVERQMEWYQRDQEQEGGTVKPWKVGLTVALIVVALQLFFLFGSKDRSDETASGSQDSVSTENPTPSPTVLPTDGGGRFLETYQ